MPARSVEFHPQADLDAEGAQQWYAQRSVVAAHAFVAELIASIESIAEAPERWPRYLAGTRRYHFPKFPYSVVYRVSPRTIVVVAIAHHRRKPGYWQDRH